MKQIKQSQRTKTEELLTNDLRLTLPLFFFLFKNLCHNSQLKVSINFVGTEVSTAYSKAVMVNSVGGTLLLGLCIKGYVKSNENHKKALKMTLTNDLNTKTFPKKCKKKKRFHSIIESGLYLFKFRV